MSVPFIGDFQEQFLPHLAYITDTRNYLELGTYTGGTIEKVTQAMVDAGRMDYWAFGVDTKRLWTPTRARMAFFEMTTEEFCREYLADLVEAHGKLDMVFIDADHRYKSVKQDFWYVFPYVREHGIIAIHDTWPDTPARLDPGYCGDSWRLADELNMTAQKRLECMTIPCAPGLTLVRKRTQHLPFELRPSS